MKKRIMKKRRKKRRKKREKTQKMRVKRWPRFLNNQIRLSKVILPY